MFGEKAARHVASQCMPSLKFMLGVAKELEIRLRKPMLTPEQIRFSLSQGKCPDCHCTECYEGPSGGSCTNIECAKCGSRFNMTPFGGERI